MTPPGHSWASRDHLFGVQNPTFFDVGSKVVPKKSLEALEIAFGTILEGFWRDLGESGDDFERILVRFWRNKLQTHHKFDTRVGGMAAATKL